MSDGTGASSGILVARRPQGKKQVSEKSGGIQMDENKSYTSKRSKNM